RQVDTGAWLPPQHHERVARPAVRCRVERPARGRARAHPAARFTDGSTIAGGAVLLPGTRATAGRDSRPCGIQDLLGELPQRLVRRTRPCAVDAREQVYLTRLDVAATKLPMAVTAAPTPAQGGGQLPHVPHGRRSVARSGVDGSPSPRSGSRRSFLDRPAPARRIRSRRYEAAHLPACPAWPAVRATRMPTVAC